MGEGRRQDGKTYLVRAGVYFGEFIGLFLLAFYYCFDYAGVVGAEIDEAIPDTSLRKVSLNCSLKGVYPILPPTGLRKRRTRPYTCDSISVLVVLYIGA